MLCRLQLQNQSLVFPHARFSMRPVNCFTTITENIKLCEIVLYLIGRSPVVQSCRCWLETVEEPRLAGCLKHPMDEGLKLVGAWTSSVRNLLAVETVGPISNA